MTDWRTVTGDMAGRRREKQRTCLDMRPSSRKSTCLWSVAMLKTVISLYLFNQSTTVDDRDLVH